MLASNPSAQNAAAATGRGAAYIEVRDLAVAYGSKVVVKNISFAVARGEHLSLLGPSGCGKSTTLRCIAGLETPIAGEIIIDGVTVFSSQKKINVPTEKRKLSMVFQSYAIWPHMTVFENVAYGLRVQRVAESELKQRVGGEQIVVAARHGASSPEALAERQRQLEEQCVARGGHVVVTIEKFGVSRNCYGLTAAELYREAPRVTHGPG